MKIIDIFENKVGLPLIYLNCKFVYEAQENIIDKIYVFHKKKFKSLYRIHDGYPVDMLGAESSITGYFKFSHKPGIYHNPLIRGEIIVHDFKPMKIILKNVAIARTKTNFAESIIKFTATHIISENGG